MPMSDINATIIPKIGSTNCCYFRIPGKWMGLPSRITAFENMAWSEDGRKTRGRGHPLETHASGAKKNVVKRFFLLLFLKSIFHRRNYLLSLPHCSTGNKGRRHRQNFLRRRKWRETCSREYTILVRTAHIFSTSESRNETIFENETEAR